MGYQEPLFNNLVPFMDAYGHDLLFQQDNASIHVSKRMQEFFHPEGIILMTHPPKSLHLNPIESVWRYLKNIVQARVPKTLDELQRWQIVSSTLS